MEKNFAEKDKSQLFKTIEVNGINWHYLEFGNPDGVPVVLLHGWLGSNAEAEVPIAKLLSGEINLSTASLAFNRLHDHSKWYNEVVPPNTEITPNYVDQDFVFVDEISKLKDKYHIIIPSLPGTDYTPPLEKPSLQNLSEETALFISKLNIKDAVLFGSSMGAIITVQIASSHPDLAKMICLQGLPASSEYMDRKMYKMGHILSSAVFSPIFKIKTIYQKLFELIMIGGADFQAASNELQQETMGRIGGADGKTVQNTLHDIGNDLIPQIKIITCPVALIDGVDADLVTPAAMKQIAEKFPNLLFIREIGNKVEGRQGHLVPETYPEAVALAINDTYEQGKSRININK